MKRRLVRLFGLFLLIFTLCLNAASCGSFDINAVLGGLGTTVPNDGDEKGSPVETPDHDHVYELRVIVPPSCGVEGRQAYVCAICGKQQYETVIAAWEHNYTTVSSWPDCTSPGKKVDHCDNCGHSKEEVLKALGHDWRSLTYHDLKTNELTITPFCARCYSAPMNEHRYKLNDIENLAVTSGGLYGDLDYEVYTDKGFVPVLKAPYYRVYCDGSYVLIVRGAEGFSAYSNSNSLYASPLDFYKAQGCTVFYEARITADGRIQSVRPR